jgi:hypothetical protein
VNPKLIIAALLAVIGTGLFGFGIYVGKKHSTVTVEPSALCKASCPDLVAPADKTFGGTTFALISQAGQYRKCQQACAR